MCLERLKSILKMCKSMKNVFGKVEKYTKNV